MSKIKNCLRRIRDKLVGRVNLSDEQIIDLLPDAIMQDAKSKQKLMDSGYGYML